MMGRIVKVTGKICLSGILAFLALTLFCMVYYHLPARLEDPDGVTDFRWAGHAFYSRGTEGFAAGRTNNEGYINESDYLPGDPVDVLVIGSSHMEALQVPEKESTAAILRKRLPDLAVYNVGLSNHDFLTCMRHLPAALNKYHPARFTIIETVNLIFPDYEFESILRRNETGGTERSRVYELVQKNHYLRLLYSQLESYRKSQAGAQGDNADNISDSPDAAPKNSAEAVGRFLSQLHDLAQAAGTKIIIAYHPKASINADGSLQVWSDVSTMRQFDELCHQHGIGFLDLSDRIQTEYQQRNVLPYGFINSAVGSGHFNAEGHRMFADELLRIMEEMERADSAERSEPLR